jgi:hypothetical protein
MIPVKNHEPVLVQDLDDPPGLAELREMCKAAGAAVSTVINSTGKVVVFYKDPHTTGIPDADFVDELHIQHRKNARLLIVVFPMDNPR